MMTTPAEARLLAYPKLMTPMTRTEVPKVTDVSDGNASSSQHFVLAAYRWREILT
jgi:hypothetical protein